MALPEPFVYYGTSEFSQRILLGLLQAGLRPSCVVTTAPKPAGRGLKQTLTPVAIVANEHQLPLIEVTTLRSPDAQKQLADHSAPIAILAAFGKILPPDVLNLYAKGIVNVHPSLLPLYRGPSPIQSALRDGQSKTGVTLIILDEEVDHGPVLAQAPLPVAPADDYPALADKLADQAVNLLLSTLPPYLAGSLTPRVQTHTQATSTSMVTREDGRADFSKTAEELSNQCRAFTPWPGLWTTWQGKLLKLIDVAPATRHGLAPGRVNRTNSALAVGCRDSSLILKTVQGEGGKVLPISEFLLGHPTFTQATLPS